MSAILVKNLKKQFFTPIPCEGSFFKKMKGYVFPRYQTVNAVNNISFSLKKGEAGLLLFRFEDMDLAASLFEKGGFKLLDDEAIHLL